MPWNSAVEAEYDALLAGNVGRALGYRGNWRNLYIAVIKTYLKRLETGAGGGLDLVPANPTYLTETERLQLHLTRVACCLYPERCGFWPWRLRDKSVAELEALLHKDHQGLYPHELPGGETVHVFHGVWDVRPFERMSVAVLAYALMGLAGAAAGSEREFVLDFIQRMRDAGWEHVARGHRAYVDGGYTAHSPSGVGTYDVEVVAAVKQGDCHTTSNYIVSMMRSFNVTAHVGFGIDEDLHRGGHCFVHWPSLGWWLDHGDNVYDGLLKPIPPEYAMRSDWWIAQYHKGASAYQWARARNRDNHLNWCLLIARTEDRRYDVPHLFARGRLREKLETIHVTAGLAARDGAPEVVPPVFSDAEVDTLMAWVEDKLT